MAEASTLHAVTNVSFIVSTLSVEEDYLSGFQIFVSKKFKGFENFCIPQGGVRSI